MMARVLCTGYVMGFFMETWKSQEETGLVQFKVGLVQKAGLKQFKLCFVHTKLVIPLFIQTSKSGKQLDT